MPQVSTITPAYVSHSQSVVVKVVVKPVQHLSLSPHFNALQLGVGSQQRLAVQMRDERGQLFNAFDAIALSYMLNVDQVMISQDTRSAQRSTSRLTLTSHFLRFSFKLLMFLSRSMIS